MTRLTRVALTMSDLNELEQAIEKLIYERTGESWIPVAFVLVCDITDPESMRLEEPFWIIPEGQRSSTTRGLIHNAGVELNADTVGSFNYVAMDDDDDEGD